MFAFRADCAAQYRFECVFSDDFDGWPEGDYVGDRHAAEIREEYPDRAIFIKRVKQWEGLRTHFHIL
jgi:hypothetical protein